MKNKLGNLNNHLFAAPERLSDEDLSADQEAMRADAIVSVADTIIDLPAFADTEDQTPLQAVTKGDLLATAVATACMIGGGALAVWMFA